MGDWNKIYRKVAKRNLVHRCDKCSRQILGGEVFYDQVFIYSQYYDLPMAKYTMRRCAKCEYHRKLKTARLEKCPHKRIEMSYRYITGEAVMEPDYEYCIDCRKTIT